MHTRALAMFVGKIGERGKAHPGQHDALPEDPITRVAQYRWRVQFGGAFRSGHVSGNWQSVLSVARPGEYSSGASHQSKSVQSLC